MARLAVAMLVASVLLDGCAHQASRTPSAEVPGRGGSVGVYSALGSGHLIRSVTPDGQSITLEDGSRWQVEPSGRYTSADWQPDQPVTVRPARSMGPYPYELTNTQDDEGVLARFVPGR